ncbi:uncharacterized protein LOC135834409 [Planococcus citri]|uniref:uncharacterized protein LOC135834409 n=1 Tax=Planococcus citri TaxID=170843 RepID=UPI0031F7FCF6
MLRTLTNIWFVTSILWLVIDTECCKFPAHWVGNWYQSGIRKTISIEGNRFSSKGSCVAVDGDKFLIANDDRSCYRCVVIHEKHYNVLQYKETFCDTHETLNKICALITGEALLYSMFRENATPISCPFKPPYTFTYNRGHGECRYPVSTIDSCTQDSKIVIQYQACPDVYGSESALEEIQCLAVWKEGSYRYLVGKVSNHHIAVGEDHYRCFVFEKSGSLPQIPLESDSTPDPDVEYRIAQSGDATCTGLFSPAEGSRTMILKRTPLNFKCKFPTWMTKKKQWHTLDYSYSYTFIQHNSTLKITNTSTTINDYYSNTRNLRHTLFNGDEVRINCVESIRSSPGYIQILTHFLTECQRGYLCITLHRRSDHIVEIQIGAPAKRLEDACHPNYFDADKTPFITLVTPEPETKVCPFFGNFRVNGVSGMEQSVSEKFTSEENPGKRPYLSSVDIMGTYSDNLSQNFFKSDNQIKQELQQRSSSSSSGFGYRTATSGGPSAFDADNVVEYAKRKISKRYVNYAKFVSRRSAVSSWNENKPNFTNTDHELYYDSNNETSGDESVRISLEDRRQRVAARYLLNAKRKLDNRIRAKREMTRSTGQEKKNSCILNFNKLYFGCRSPDTMEFRSDCPLFSSDIISVYLCHGSWSHNVSRNSSIHYLVTTPLSRTSRGVRRYCFMYQTNEDSSLIHFTSTSDTCHRGSVPGLDGALSFNITPIGGAGKCAELNSTSLQFTISSLTISATVIHCLLIIYSLLNPNR